MSYPSKVPIYFDITLVSGFPHQIKDVELVQASRPTVQDYPVRYVRVLDLDPVIVGVADQSDH
jgi:hypothetical protein